MRPLARYPVSAVAVWVACMVALHGTHALAQQGGESLRSAKVAEAGHEGASPEVRHVADWAVHSRDPQGRPFAVVDKVHGRLYVFDAQGGLLGATAALVGSAPGDLSVPGIGERPIASIRPEERTTPAGRFEARMGVGPKGEDILWVDYQNALALHRVVTNVPQERRLQRLASQVAGDRRITYGCINVPAAFYDGVVRPAFAGGGVVYILPEQRRPQELFGSYDVDAPRVVHASTAAAFQRP
ncbi:hypothetical protein [Ramlibacter pallidus]|uniref:L,D-transpeptidase n=1 Tax=Ramlibacter pallidus TaxID=2780087 RepID=A0ABR9S182_9BURK|nr:hypothetical protein [Ramlibacter pallidus]MBE7367246.1 hypothetical protein [Ramlibacter pallidus]